MDSKTEKIDKSKWKLQTQHVVLRDSKSLTNNGFALVLKNL